MARTKKISTVTTEKVWFNEHEARAYIGFGNKDTFLGWRNTGQLPYSQIGRRIIYSRWDLDKLVLKNQVGHVTYAKN